MDPTIPTPTASSTVTNSDVSSSMPTFYVLDISLISAQDLAHVSKSMRTYAITWIHPSRKLTSRVDQQSHKNPLWNDRFAFRVDSDFLESDQAEVTVEIYTVSWFRDVLVGTVKVLISDLITPSARNGTRYVALQVRRPSGNPQGILNMGVSLMDATNRSMHLLGEINPLIVDYQDELAKKMNRKASLKDKLGDDDNLYDDMADEVNEKVHLWRAYNAGITEFNDKEGSMVNGSSMCNGEAGMGSELCSDVGPSASVVAAEIARHSLPPLAEKSQTAHPPSKAKADPHKNNNVEDFGSSIVEEMTVEEATAKGLKANSGILKKEVSLPPKQGGKMDRSKSDTGQHSRRHSDGGLFSCFGNAYGFEFGIVCGASNHGNKPNISKSSRSSSKRRIVGSETNSA
ncbi:OLC1v1025880C1 [Oldenlandia corymbosa var. corymbosa]|uniref:OLC1v1025880C1 n=1 Tax=Oldenlandia corymbosa var. corymbosa TaxID=529605 RepID=A0AAV1C5R1_OLDCO|nr:OLC1v1025880C1 [Oldenlandia corymbosa var. corymbosa]